MRKSILNAPVRSGRDGGAKQQSPYNRIGLVLNLDGELGSELCDVGHILTPT
jgi:hypothetical protein